MSFPIIWPDRRTLTDTTVDLWYSDAVANGDIDPPQGQLTVQEKALELHHAGLITLQQTR